MHFDQRQFVCMNAIRISIRFDLIDHNCGFSNGMQLSIIYNISLSSFTYSLPQSFHNQLNNFTPDFDFSRSRLCYCCWFPVFRVKNSQKMYLIIDSPGFNTIFSYSRYLNHFEQANKKKV